MYNFSRQSEAEKQQNNDNTDNMQVDEVNFEKVKKGKPKKRLIITIVIVIAVLVLGVIGSNLNKGIEVEKYHCMSGAVLGIDLETFCSELNKNVNKTYKETTGEKTEFDITKYLNNLVEPQTDYEDETGCEFTMYSAFIDKLYCVTISEMDDKVSHIRVSFDYDNNDIPTVLAHGVIRTLSGLNRNESEKIRKTIVDGIIENTWVYKDGILYGIEASTVSYSFFAASEEFVKQIENAGCKIIYWD